VQSYRQLPFTLYQYQTKYRDELRPRAGLLRGREFLMKDAYSFHADEADLDRVYGAILDAYHRIFRRVGLEGVVDVEALGGDMADRNSHEFQWISPVGEDTVYICDACGFRSNKEILTGGDKDAEDIAACPKCGADLRIARAVEVGNIFRLGGKYTRAMKVSFNDERGEKRTPVMGCYGIGITRTLGCLLEASGSDSKAVFNLEVAPYKVHVVSLGGDAGAVAAAEKLYSDLAAAGIKTIIDATDDRAGSKFANADLLGAPIRVVSSEKNFARGVFEIAYSGIKPGPAELKIGDSAGKIISMLGSKG
jgi:prolyl-tRNA synthetase